MFLGALLSALVAVALDWAKRPRFKIKILTLPHRVKQYGVMRNVLAEYDAVLVKVCNPKRWPKFWPRQSAVNVMALISFHDANSGMNLFENRQMRGRWATQPQPEVVIIANGQKQTWSDPSLVSAHPSIDIAWGESEELDVACRFVNEDGAYGFSNENYYDEAGLYRVKRWHIKASVCLVRIEVRGTGEKRVEVLEMRNIKGTGKLKLLPSTRHKKKLVR